MRELREGVTSGGRSKRKRVAYIDISDSEKEGSHGSCRESSPALELFNKRQRRSALEGLALERDENAGEGRAPSVDIFWTPLEGRSPMSLREVIPRVVSL